MNTTHPYFPKDSRLFKGAGDYFNTKMLTNPLGFMKDTATTFKKNPLQGIVMASGTGRALMPDNVTGYAKAMSGGPEYSYDSTKSFSDIGGTALPTPTKKMIPPPSPVSAQQAEDNRVSSQKTLITGIL